jgi:hypothetical protein
VLFCDAHNAQRVHSNIETDEGQGMFSWDKTVDCLAGSKGDTMRDRQLCVVAHLFELGHDLMMSQKFDLSRTPAGFEAAGLISFEKDNQWMHWSDHRFRRCVRCHMSNGQRSVMLTTVRTRQLEHCCS